MLNVNPMLQLVFEHDEGVGLQVDAELFLCLELLALRCNGLLVEVVLGIRCSGEGGLRGHLLQAEASEVDVGALGLVAGIAELHVEAACLDVEYDGLAVVGVGLRLDGASGIALEIMGTGF